VLLDSIQTKQQVLAEFLKICPLEGWSEVALSQAIANCKIEPKFSQLIFENGCLDLAEFYIEEQNQKAAENILAVAEFHQQKIRDKIRLSIYARFEVEKDHKVALQRLINFYLNPKNFTALEVGARPMLQALKASYKISDSMWKGINDQSTDFNFYTKRLTLTKIIWRCLPVFLKDESLDFEKTKKLIDLEIEKVMKFETHKRKVKKLSIAAKEAFCQVVLDENGAPKSAKEIIKNLPFIRLFKF
jgi:ubiquinone biosynthesis protein COQ9